MQPSNDDNDNTSNVAGRTPGGPAVAASVTVASPYLAPLSVSKVWGLSMRWRAKGKDGEAAPKSELE